MRRVENDVTQRSIQVSANQPASLSRSSRIVTANVESDVHSIPHSNADVCATDRQRHRSLSLKPAKASSATRQRALGAHQLK